VPLCLLIAGNLAIAGSASVPIRDGQAIKDARQADAVPRFRGDRLAPAQAGAELAEKAAQASQKAADLAASDARKQADMALQQQTRYSLARLKAGLEGTNSVTSSLLVLTSQTKPEDISMILEDLNIMSRILDSKSPTGRSPYHVLENLYGRSTSYAGAAQTQAMYVQSYAAIFFIDVDFPLSPPPEMQVETVKEGTDPVWEQTKRGMMESDKNLGLEYMNQRDATARQYDKDTVEQFKTALVKALKHAANIRNLKADESVILVVAGTKVPTVSGSILTIRAKKADIDAYAAAKIDYDQFRQRTAILTSRASPGPGQAPTSRSWLSTNSR